MGTRDGRPAGEVLRPRIQPGTRIRNFLKAEGLLRDRVGAGGLEGVDELGRVFLADAFLDVLRRRRKN